MKSIIIPYNEDLNILPTEILTVLSPKYSEPYCISLRDYLHLENINDRLFIQDTECSQININGKYYPAVHNRSIDNITKKFHDKNLEIHNYLQISKHWKTVHHHSYWWKGITEPEWYENVLYYVIEILKNEDIVEDVLEIPMIIKLKQREYLNDLLKKAQIHIDEYTKSVLSHTKESLFTSSEFNKCQKYIEKSAIICTHNSKKRIDVQLTKLDAFNTDPNLKISHSNFGEGTIKEIVFNLEYIPDLDKYRFSQINNSDFTGHFPITKNHEIVECKLLSDIFESENKHPFNIRKFKSIKDNPYIYLETSYTSTIQFIYHYFSQKPQKETFKKIQNIKYALPIHGLIIQFDYFGDIFIKWNSFEQNVNNDHNYNFEWLVNAKIIHKKEGEGIIKTYNHHNKNISIGILFKKYFRYSSKLIYYNSLDVKFPDINQPQKY